MGKMGKTRRNSCNKKTSIHTEESCTKKSCSKIKKRTQNSTHTLLEKYKNILGSRQLVVVLEKCSISKNISQSNSLQVLSKNSVNNTHNANHTSKLVHSINNVSHQSPCVEKTTNHKSVHNLKVDRSKSSKINSKQAAVKKIYYSLGEVSSNTKVSKNVLKTSSTCSKRNASSKRKKPIPKIYESDSSSGSEKIMGDHPQKNKLNEKIAEPQKCNTETEIADTIKMCKRRDIYTQRTDSRSSETDSVDIPKTDFSINGTVTTDTRETDVCSSKDIDLISLQERSAILRGNCLTKHNAERIVVDIKESTKSEDDTTFLAPENFIAINLKETLIEPRSNELSKHTKKHTVTRSPKRTIIEDTEDTLSASARNLINSSTNIVQSSERFIVPSSNELSKHTKKHTVTCSPKRTIIEDTEDKLSASSRNLINSSTNIVQSSERFIVPSSNELSKHTKKHTVTRSPKRTIIEDTEDKLSASSRNLINSSTNIVQSSERFIVPSSNELSKHTKKHTITCSLKRTIIEDIEDKLSASARNLINSSTNIVQSPERFIVPSSNESSKHTKKHTLTRSPKRTIIEDTEDKLSASTKNLINSATNIVQSSGRSIVSCSNDSNKQTKESSVVNIQKSIKVKEKVSEENNVEHDASHHQHEQKSLQKQKRVHSEDSSSSQDVTKVKLNRTGWRRRLESVNKAVDTSKEVDKTEGIVELKKNEEIPQFICAEVPRPSIVFPEEGNITHGIQVAEANLTTERVVSSIEKQNSIETFGYSNRLECDARKDARTSQNAATEIRVLQKTPTEIHIPVVENTSPVTENSTFNNSCPQYDEDDCISLFADSKLIEEYDVPETFQSRRMNEAPLDTEKQYSMTHQMIEIFYNKNAFEFNEAYNVNYSNNNTTPIVPQRRKPIKIDPHRVKPVETVSQREKSAETVPQREKLVETVSQREKSAETVPQREKLVETVSQKEKQMEQVQTIPRDITARLTLNPQTRMNMRTINQSNQDVFLSVFRGFCYTTIRTGVCYKNPCHYNHNFLPHLMLLYNNNESRFFEVIDNLIQARNTMFLKCFYQECIRPDTNPICVLKLLKKLYNSSIISEQIIYSSIKQLITYRVTINQIVDNLVKIVNNSDTQFVTSVLQVLVIYTAPGNGWPMLKPLLTRIAVVPEDVIQYLLIDCITTRKHVQDVYEHVVRKLDYESLTLLNQNFLVQFHRIHRQLQENVKVQETVASTSVTIASPNPFDEVELTPYTVQTTNLSPKVWKNVIFDGNNNAQGGNSSVLLQPIDNVPNPYSKLSRERFWKFYLDVHSLEVGLKHKDYRHIKKILDEAQKRHVSPFTNACYNILRSKVEHSQAHLSKLASLAVQDGATATFCKIIINVTIHILADLAERELWVLALTLLKSLGGILHEQSSLFKFDAIVTMLFCEIYLANRKPMKAFNLLKQSNILCTYRGKWKVRNNKRDDDIRAQIVTILLDMLCDTSPEHAFSLFEFIILDQSSNFYPIDLSRQVNKLVSLLLLRNDHELISSIGKLIDDYNCTLYSITHRALISSLVRINLPLAKQLYQNAVLLGVYPEMQFYPVMHIIVKSDWTGEEMFLAIWTMMQKFLENLGHAIEGVKPNNLSSYLVFEAMPLEKQLVNYKGMNEQYEKKRKGSIELMKKVLETEFDPPLSLVKKRKDKVQRINSVSLYRYLQCNQNCM